MHDGAVLIRNNRVVAAGCKLPLTTNEEVARGMGTRHRAAIGVSEVSDCVVVVVSEEKHVISVANSGFIKRDYNRNINDFRNEETLKLIQNSLRQDLFLLLAGMPLEKSEREGKRYALKNAKGDRSHDKGTKGAGVMKSSEVLKSDKAKKSEKPYKGSVPAREEVDECEIRADVIPTPTPEADTPVIVPTTKTEAATENDRNTAEDA